MAKFITKTYTLPKAVSNEFLEELCTQSRVFVRREGLDAFTIAGTATSIAEARAIIEPHLDMEVDDQEYDVPPDRDEVDEVDESRGPATLD
jgi:hypothetical protein